MIMVDRALRARQEEARPIRVGMVGAGFMGKVHAADGPAVTVGRSAELALSEDHD